jgi:hypothetical protein
MYNYIAVSYLIYERLQVQQEIFTCLAINACPRNALAV